MNAIERLKEPSTWAGLGLLASLVGVPPGTLELVTQVATGIAGLAAIFLKERAAR